MKADVCGECVVCVSGTMYSVLAVIRNASAVINEIRLLLVNHRTICVLVCIHSTDGSTIHNWNVSYMKYVDATSTELSALTHCFFNLDDQSCVYIN